MFLLPLFDSMHYPMLPQSRLWLQIKHQKFVQKNTLQNHFISQKLTEFFYLPFA
jgi:hypothetical protein